MADVHLTDRKPARADDKISFYGVHHLALNTDDMKMTVDFYVGVLGMRLVHAMKVPPGLGTGPGDFARYYVVAHEYGHHVQNLTGVAAQISSAQQQNPSQAARLVRGLAAEPGAYPRAARGEQGAL